MRSCRSDIKFTFGQRQRMAGMNIQQRTAETLPTSGRSTAQDVSQASAQEQLLVADDVTARKEAEQALQRRREEQTALFRFSEKLQYTASLPDIYEAALD